MKIFLYGFIVLLAVYESIYFKKNDFKWKNEGWIAFLVIALSIVLFEYKTGILSSGYHFVDDHEIFNHKGSFAEKGIINTFTRTIISDLNIRFRPTYRLLRVFEALILGTSFSAWHLFFMLQTIVTFFFAYVFARKMSCSAFSSLLFVVVIFVGPQSAVWWKLGPQEMIGMLLLMLNLLCLCEYALHNTIKYTITSIVLAALLGGVKESFLLLLPVLPVFLIIFAGGNDWLHINDLLGEIKQRKAYVIGIMAIFIIDMSVILFRVGMLQIGYAGIDASMGIEGYAKAMINICLGPLNWYCIMVGLAVILLLIPLSILVFTKNRSKFVEYLSAVFWYLIIFAYCIGTQLILYAKSGMRERYLLPSTFAFAFLLIIGLNQIINITEINPLSYHVITVILVAGIISNMDLQEDARRYAQDGMKTTALLNTVGENAQPDTKVLVSLDPELDYSTSIYLQEKFNIIHTYNMNFSENESGMAGDAYIKNEDEREKAAIKCEEADIYIGYSHVIETFMTDMGLNIDDFKQYIYGEYTVFVINGYRGK